MALSSWMCAVGSVTIAVSSFAESPRVSPLGPQWNGMPIWWIVRPPAVNVGTRRVTMTRASTAPRAVMIVAQPPLLSPRISASCGETSQKNSGCSSDRYADQRLIRRP